VQASPDEDPCSASANPAANGNTDRCILTGLPASEIGTWEATVGVPTTFIGGGNPLLAPEEAETFTFGAVFTLDALPNLQFSIDYFELNVEDTIGGLVADVVCFDPLNTAGLFCDSIRRDPVTFDIVEFFEPQVNKGILETSGIDTQINWATDILSGDLVVDVVWTHMLKNSFQETSFGTVFDCAGRFGWPCNAGKSGTTYPSDRVTTNFNYNYGDLNVFLNWLWIGGTDNAAPLGSGFFGVPDPDLVVPTVSTKNYFGLGFGYRINDNIIARLAIANLTETSPAFMADAGAGGNTDPGMYDLFGRSYTLSFSLQY
jgi:outer membrane receptor protein involved in Fe transport